MGSMTPEKSDHFDGRDSSIRPAPSPQPFRRSRGCCASRAHRWPARIDAAAANASADLDGAAAVVTFIGHSTFLIQTAAGTS